MKTYSRVYASVNLDYVKYNMERMRDNIHSDTKMIAVLKTDGYGHGAVPIAHVMEDMDYVWGYAVATLDEGVVLKSDHIEKPVLVLGCIFPDQYYQMLQHDIRMNVYTEEMAEAISELAVAQGRTAYIHIKLDTGMGRLGFAIDEENAQKIKEVAQLPNIKLEGLFTHFAKADEVDKAFTDQQIEKYQWMAKRLKEIGIEFPYYHCSNSAGIIDLPGANMDLVRAGISIYGLYPSEEVEKSNVDLKPSLELKSHVAFVKEIGAGIPISYGGTFVSDKPMKIATIPVGYGDGYPRSLSNKGYVLIKGKRAPIVGRICMDQFMVDVTDIEDVRFGNKVTLIGYDKEDHISVEDLSDISGRFNYEFVCDLGKRIPRVYIQNGEITEQVDYFV